MRAATPKDPSSELEAMRTTSQDHMGLDCLAGTHNKDTVTGVVTGASSYPYMEAEAGELTAKDVEKLLSLYKDVVAKYTSLSRAVGVRSLPFAKSERPVPDLDLELEEKGEQG